jgi:hypothetical protein
MMRTLLLLAAMLAIPCAQAQQGERVLFPFVWTDVTGSRDMPWVGAGGRAHWYKRDVTKPTDIMNPRGPTIETRWGASASSGESPWDTGNRAADFLEKAAIVKEWPEYPPSEGRPSRRAFPYRVTIVCIQPTIAILRFDLSAAIDDPIEFSFGAFPAALRDAASDQTVASGNLTNAVMFGTHLLGTGSLLWFSPDGNVAPTPLDFPKGRATITARGVTLNLELRSGEISVTR